MPSAACLRAILLLVLLTVGCSSQRAIETADAPVAESAEEGRRAGEAAGFEAASTMAYESAYRETVHRIYFTGEFSLIPFYVISISAACFTAGFCLQWIVLYIPRRMGILRDIDWILLPRTLTEVDLTDLPVTGLSNHLRAAGPVILIFMLLQAPGCSGSGDDAWPEGPDTGYSAAYREGWQTGAARGRAEGAERGALAAQHDAATGRAWGLYDRIAGISLLAGIALGVSAQYLILLQCRLSGRLPELVTVLFIPAMRHSLAFSLLEEARKLRISCFSELKQIAAAKQIQLNQMQTVRTVMTRKLRTLSSLEELNQAQLVDLAKRDLHRIVAASERTAVEREPLIHTCPECGMAFEFVESLAGKPVECPNRNCCRPMTLPPALQPDDQHERKRDGRTEAERLEPGRIPNEVP